MNDLLLLAEQLVSLSKEEVQVLSNIAETIDKPSVPIESN